MRSPRPVTHRTTPEPTDEEAAAIAAAIEVTWPRAAPAVANRENRWRFSGRWWVRPVPLRRTRPWNVRWVNEKR